MSQTCIKLLCLNADELLNKICNTIGTLIFDKKCQVRFMFNNTDLNSKLKVLMKSLLILFCRYMLFQKKKKVNM